MSQILLNYLSLNLTFNDSPEPWGLFFQDNATPQMEGLKELHNNIMFYLAIISFAVSWFTFSIIINNRTWLFKNHKTLVKLILTITLVLALVLIAILSFKLLYLLEEIIDPSLVIYGKGHQWYWSYQYPDFTNKDEEFVEFESYMFQHMGNHLPSTKSSFDFWGLLFQDRNPGSVSWDQRSSSSSASEISPLEEARWHSVNSNDDVREAKFNLELNQANIFGLIEGVANRELSDTARSTFSDINNDRRDITDSVVQNARSLIINATTESDRALIETRTGYANLAVQQCYLDKGYAVVQDCGANFTTNEQNQHAAYLNENASLWAEYTRTLGQHVENLNFQRPLDIVDNQSAGNIRRTSLVRELADTRSETSDNSDSDS